METGGLVDPTLWVGLVLRRECEGGECDVK